MRLEPGGPQVWVSASVPASASAGVPAATGVPARASYRRSRPVAPSTEDAARHDSPPEPRRRTVVCGRYGGSESCCGSPSPGPQRQILELAPSGTSRPRDRHLHRRAIRSGSRATRSGSLISKRSARSRGQTRESTLAPRLPSGGRPQTRLAAPHSSGAVRLGCHPQGKKSQVGRIKGPPCRWSQILCGEQHLERLALAAMAALLLLAASVSPAGAVVTIGSNLARLPNSAANYSPRPT